MASRSSFAFAAVTSIVVLAAPGCGGGDDEPNVGGYVSGVSTADGAIHASYVAGALPAAGAGPTLAVSTNAAVIPGGTTPAALIGDAAFTRVVIAVDGVDGYYALDLPSAQSSVELIVTLSQDLAVPGFDWLYGVGDAGAMGDYTITPVSVVAVGTGDVQISLSWNSAADVDLHVVDPAGEEIYYGHRDSLSGGQLDLDSNAACGSDGPRNENITWPVHGAPDGTYHVLVDYWDNCEAASTDFTVAVNAVDQDTQTMTGNFTGEGDRGGEGDGVAVATLVVGPSATASPAGRRDLGTFEVHLAPGATPHTKSP